MKQFKVMAVAAVAGLMMAACAKDGENGGQLQNDGTTSVKIQISYDQGKTRAVGSAVTGQLTPTVGHIFFADASGVIDTHVGVGNTAGGVQVTLADLQNGEAVIEGISSQATKCYIVMNDVKAKIKSATGITGNLKGANIDAAFAAVSIPVGNLWDATGGVVNVPLYGAGDVTSVTAAVTGDGKAYNAHVEVEIDALTSRIQIGKISAAVYNYVNNSISQTVTIDDFKVEGIYINNYHPTYTTKNGGATVIDGGDDPVKYSTSAGAVYASGGTGEKLADYLNVAATGSPLAVAQPAGSYWAYNVFPGTVVPHVIVKLTDIKYTDSFNGSQQTLETPRFLTLASFKYGAGHTNAGDPVTEFEATNTYTLSEISFNFEDLTTIPYDTTMDVLVEIEMMTWADNPIEWNN